MGILKKALLMFCFIILFSSVGFANTVPGNLEMIYPTSGPVIGTEYNYIYQNYQPYLKTVYNYNDGQVNYKVGSRVQLKRVYLDLNYGYWLNDDLLSYSHQQGFEGKSYYAPGIDKSLRMTAFYGKVGRDINPEVETAYLKANYGQQLYFDFDREVNLRFSALTGQAIGSGENYYLANLELPTKIKNLRILPQFGYIEQDEIVKPYYSLENHVRGSDWNQKKGNRLATITLEYQRPLFSIEPDNNIKLLLSQLRGAIFLDAGGVLESDQQLTDFDLHYSGGTALVLPLGLMELRLEEIVTEEGEWSTQFAVGAVY